MTNDARGHYLKQLREAARLGVRDIADEFGMSRQQILNYEDGSTPVGAEKFVELVMAIRDRYNAMDREYKRVLGSLTASEITAPAEVEALETN